MGSWLCPKIIRKKWEIRGNLAKSCKPWGKQGLPHTCLDESQRLERSWEKHLNLSPISPQGSYYLPSLLCYQEDLRIYVSQTDQLALWSLGYHTVLSSWRPGALWLGVDTPLPNAASPWPLKGENRTAGPPSVKAVRMSTLTPCYYSLTRFQERMAKL